MDRRKKHGLCPRGKQSKKYTAWCNIKRRCVCSDHPAYENYGGRGIRMHQPWCDDFELFAREVPDCPSPELTFDREDNDRGYEPGNVRWVTRKVQANNRRLGKSGIGLAIEYCGRTQSLAAWCRERGLNYQTTHSRLKHGWSVADVLS